MIQGCVESKQVSVFVASVTAPAFGCPGRDLEARRNYRESMEWRPTIASQGPATAFGCPGRGLEPSGIMENPWNGGPQSLLEALFLLLDTPAGGLGTAWKCGEPMKWTIARAPIAKSRNLLSLLHSTSYFQDVEVIWDFILTESHLTLTAPGP